MLSFNLPVLISILILDEKQMLPVKRPKEETNSPFSIMGYRS